MLLKPYRLTPLNNHYEGSYSESALKWRSICAADKADNIVKSLNHRKVQSILEVGCGTGSVLAKIAARNIGNEHVGVDMADPALHCDPEAIALDLRVFDGKKLPFGDKSFDLVYATHVVEHIPNPREFLNELRRVARKYVYIEVPCEARAIISRRKMQASLDTGHINFFSPEYFFVLLQTAGMDILEFELFDHSVDVHSFGTSKLNGYLRGCIRKGLLQVNPLLAARIFCYHCGALMGVECIGEERV